MARTSPLTQPTSAESRSPPVRVEHVDAALAFVRTQGVVLASAKGAVPRLVEAILGAPISGNWWAHPMSSFIYNVLAAASESDDVLVCRLLGGKVTLVHRRLWPALVRVAGCFDPVRLAWVRQIHTSGGRHVNREIAFPRWVPAAVREQAALLSEQEALLALGPAVSSQATRDPWTRERGGKRRGSGRP